MADEREGAEPVGRVGQDEDEASRRALRGVRRATLVAVIVAVAIAVVVVTQVPLTTTVEYSRLSQGWNLPVGILAVVPLVLVPPYVKTAKFGPDDLPSSQRKGLIIAAAVFIGLMLGAQVVMGWGFLEAGGAV